MPKRPSCPTPGSLIYIGWHEELALVISACRRGRHRDYLVEVLMNGEHVLMTAYKGPDGRVLGRRSRDWDDRLHGPSFIGEWMPWHEEGTESDADADAWSW